VFFFLAVCLCSVVFSVDPSKSLRGFITKTFEWFVVFYLVTGLFSDRKHILKAVKVYVLTTLLTAVDALVQFYWLGHDIFRNRDMVRDGATAAFPHPNSLAGYCVIAVPFFLALCFLPHKKQSYRCVLIFLWGLVSWALILTFSRAGWLAALWGGLIFLFYRNKRILAGVMIAAVLFSWCFVRFSPLEVRKRTRTRPEIVREDIRWRARVWGASLSLVKEKPLFGQGLNTYMDVVQRTRVGQEPIYAHNCFVQVLVETGLLGLGGFLWILVSLARAASQTVRRVYPAKKDKELAVIMLGALSGLTAFLVHSFFDVHFYSLQLSVYFWLIAGILMSIIRVLHAGAGGPFDEGRLKQEDNP
jgi:O-antigen ligase